MLFARLKNGSATYDGNLQLGVHPLPSQRVRLMSNIHSISTIQIGIPSLRETSCDYTLT
jgi:hypothetical protein